MGLRICSVDLPTGRIAYVEEGSGPVMLLLHGAPMTSLAFVRVIRGLRGRYRVIAPDLPGFGLSAAASDFGGSLSEYTAFVEQFCGALELRDIVLYVNDSSGCFGLRAAANMCSRVAGLVVADTVPLPLTGLAWPVKLLLKYVVTSWPVRVLNRRMNLLAWLVAVVAPLLRPLSRTERRTLTAQFNSPERRDRILDLFSHMARDEGFMEATAQAIVAHLADTPTLILYGQFDPMRLIGGVARFEQMFQNSRVAVIPWEEHFPILASGARVAAEVDHWFCNEVRVNRETA